MEAIIESCVLNLGSRLYYRKGRVDELGMLKQAILS
jgi:hypothetical protein